MPKAAAVMKLLADLNDLARAARPLHSQILDALLTEAREEIQKYVTNKDELQTPVRDQKKLPPP